LTASLFVPLATEPFREFQSGRKTVEVRQDAPRWRGVEPGRAVRLRRGYSTPDELHGNVTRVYRGAFHDAPAWVREGARVRLPTRFFDAEKPVVAFEVGL
jgi:hypothetical protein